MTRYITGILILLLVSVATSQAQRKEPEIKACERQIEKLKKAPDDVTFARELYNTGIYCLDRGMYDEAALLASLAAAFNAQDSFIASIVRTVSFINATFCSVTLT